MISIKQNTPVSVPVGPVFKTSTNTPHTGTLAYTDFKICKNGTWGSLAATDIATHSHEGHFQLTLAASDVATLGELVVALNKTGYDMPPRAFEVQTANVYDSLVAGTDRLDVESTEMNITTHEVSIKTDG